MNRIELSLKFDPHVRIQFIRISDSGDISQMGYFSVIEGSYLI